MLSHYFSYHVRIRIAFIDKTRLKGGLRSALQPPRVPAGQCGKIGCTLQHPLRHSQVGHILLRNGIQQWL